VSFKAGKIALYSDFDGTYMPYNHLEISCPSELDSNETKRANFHNIFGEFSDYKFQ
jgi:hypothetical protein